MSESPEETKKEEAAEVETGPGYSMQAENMAKRITSTVDVMNRLSPDVAREVVQILMDVEAGSNDIDSIDAFRNRLQTLADGG